MGAAFIHADEGLPVRGVAIVGIGLSAEVSQKALELLAFAPVPRVANVEDAGVVQS